jgi:hexosaminidase
MQDLDSEAPLFRLDSSWGPAGGAAGSLSLTLVNLSRQTLRRFRLALTSHVKIDADGELRGATLIDQLSTYHLMAPPADFVLAPGASWSVVASRLSHAPRHYTSGVMSAYLISEDGAIMPVAATPTASAPAGDRQQPRELSPEPPEGSLSIGVLPFPLAVNIADRRDPADALHLADGPAEARLAFEAAAALAGRLFPSGAPLFSGSGGIVCTARSAKMADEGYRVEFAADAVTLVASGRQGFFYGFVTLGQMLDAARRAPHQFGLPLTGRVTDAPRFGWRGMLLDVARQAYQIDDLLRLVDLLAWHKLNRLHLHLSDDEGWRLDIPGYPQLAALAGWRGHGLAIPPLLGSPPGRYGVIYSAADIARLEGRARDVAVTIVPEIEMPGHNYGLLQAIPGLRDPSESGVYRSVQQFPNNALNPAVPKTYEVVEAVLDEVARLFSSHWIHVGADELPPDAWRGSPLARRFMAERGWEDTYQLQSHFLRRVQETLRGLGRGMGGWQEAALGGGVEARDCYLVAWLGSESGIALARQGYDVVLAPGEAYYLDMAQSEHWWEPGAGWAGAVSPERCYSYDPGGDWPDQIKPRLMGVQACLWSENLHDRSIFDHLTFPRLAAVAESAWTASERKDFGRFSTVQRLMPRSGIR